MNRILSLVLTCVIFSVFLIQFSWSQTEAGHKKAYTLISNMFKNADVLEMIDYLDDGFSIRIEVRDEEHNFPDSTDENNFDIRLAKLQTYLNSLGSQSLVRKHQSSSDRDKGYIIAGISRKKKQELRITVNYGFDEENEPSYWKIDIKLNSLAL